MVRIGRIIRQAREQRGLAQNEAAKAAGLTKQQWHDWEQGNHTPGYRSLTRIADVLGLTVIGLLSIEPKRK